MLDRSSTKAGQANRIRRFFSWIVVIVSTLFGVYGLAGIAATPHRGPVIGLFGLVVGVLSVLAPLVAIWNSRTAARIYLWIAPAALVLILPFHEPFGYGILARDFPGWNGLIAVTTAAFVFVSALIVPWCFWRFAVRHNWPGLLADPPHRPRIVRPAGLFAFLCLFIMAMLLSLNLPWRDLLNDCFGQPLLSEGVPFGSDFTASILFVGPRTHTGYSFWSVVRVHDAYSPEARAMPRLAILRGEFKPQDVAKEYFVEGRRSSSPIGRILPVIQPIDCGHTKPLEEAAVELRVLRDGPPKSGFRLIGKVVNGDRWNGAPPLPVPGAKVFLDGPGGRAESLTDIHGIYDVTRTVPGDYTVSVATTEQIAIRAKTGDVQIVNLWRPYVARAR